MSSITAWIFKNRVMTAYIMGCVVVGCFMTLMAIDEAEAQVNAKAASKKG